jgi:hypothetical protein
MPTGVLPHLIAGRTSDEFDWVEPGEVNLEKQTPWMNW